MRHTYYIEGHGWGGLTSRDGRETDEFDEGGVVYLMRIDPFGDVAASVRLNPTLGPTLLKKFADWSDAPLPEAESVWDVSRWIAAPQHRRANNPRWPTNHQRELMIGILEFGLSRRLTHLTMLAEHRLAERIESYGWPLRYLGAPREYEGGKGTAVAAEIEMGLHVLNMTRSKTGIARRLLMRWTALHPAGSFCFRPMMEESHGTGCYDRIGHCEVGLPGTRDRCTRRCRGATTIAAQPGAAILRKEGSLSGRDRGLRFGAPLGSRARPAWP